MATLTVVAINNKTLTDSNGAVTTLTKQFNYDQVVFGPVAFVPANHTPHTATGLAYFTYDEGLARPTKYVVSDSLATTRAYFLAAGALRTTAVPASAVLPSIGVGVYGTPVVEEGLANTAAIVSNINTATNKTIAGDFSAAYYGESKNTAAVAHATIVTFDGLSTTRANVYEAYGVRGKLTIAVATATHESYGMLTSIFGHTTITGAVSQGLVSSGAFILGGAAAVTQSCYGVYISILTGVTTLTAALGITNAGNAAYGIQLVGTYSTGILMSACTTGISLAGATTTGILIGGATTTGISITGTSTDALSITGIPTGKGIKVQYSPSITSGDAIGQQNRICLAADGTQIVYGYQGQTGVNSAISCAGIYDIWSNPIMKGTSAVGTNSGNFVALRATLETEATGAGTSGTVTGKSIALWIQNQMSGGTTTTGGVYPIYIDANGGTKAWTADIRLSGGPTISSGAGAPSSVQPVGSVYFRTDGSSTSTRLYVCSVANGTWVAVTTAS